MDLVEAFNQLQSQELIHKFIEIGKVLLTWAILKNVDMVKIDVYVILFISTLRSQIFDLSRVPLLILFPRDGNS